jgi:thioredoxin reductase
MYSLQQLKAESEKSKDSRFDIQYQTMTSTKGIFGAGDCVDHVYKQASTAAGMGVQASLDVERWLENND